MKSGELETWILRERTDSRDIVDTDSGAWHGGAEHLKRKTSCSLILQLIVCYQYVVAQCGFNLL